MKTPKTAYIIASFRPNFAKPAFYNSGSANYELLTEQASMFLRKENAQNALDKMPHGEAKVCKIITTEFVMEDKP